MKNKLNIIVTLFIAINISACNSSSENKKPESKPTEATYKTMHIKQMHLGSSAHLPGLMQPFEFVQLYPRITGFIKKVLVDRGSYVKQGQTLITLEAPEIEQQVASAKLKFVQANANYLTGKDRYNRLLEASQTSGTVSPFDLSSAADKMQGDSATVQGEFANYRAMETMKGYLTVTAPFDGIITERNVHPGALVGPGTQNVKPMLVLQQLSKLRLVVDVPDQFAAQIKNGDSVHFKINSLPGQEYTGKISRSSQSLNNSYRSETIEIDIDNKKNNFKPGMYAEVVLPVSGNVNAFIVPKSAIITTTERKYIILLNNNISKWCDITEGNQSNDSTEIFGKLQPEDEVIINANYQIKEGQMISK